MALNERGPPSPSTTRIRARRLPIVVPFAACLGDDEVEVLQHEQCENQNASCPGAVRQHEGDREGHDADQHDEPIQEERRRAIPQGSQGQGQGHPLGRHEVQRSGGVGIVGHAPSPSGARASTKYDSHATAVPTATRYRTPSFLTTWAKHALQQAGSQEHQHRPKQQRGGGLARGGEVPNTGGLARKQDALAQRQTTGAAEQDRQDLRHTVGEQPTPRVQRTARARRTAPRTPPTSGRWVNRRMAAGRPARNPIANMRSPTRALWAKRKEENSPNWPASPPE